MKKLLLVLFVAGATLVGCQKEEKKELAVFTSLNSGLNVYLFKTLDDALIHKNLVAEKKSSEKGVYFDVPYGKYYVVVGDTPCASNILDFAKGNNSIDFNAENHVFRAFVTESFVAEFYNTRNVSVEIDLSEFKDVVTISGKNKFILNPGESMPVLSEYAIVPYKLDGISGVDVAKSCSEKKIITIK